MAALDDLIRFENENSALDFKAVQYDKAKHEKLLIDLLAFANADVAGDRYIIVGVKHRADSSREILGISEPFIDAATYQQLARENIEPELDLDYFAHSIDDKRVGILVIRGCTEQPYQMRKDFGVLKRGDAFIRKGSHQPRLAREDFERIYARRSERASDLGRHIRLGFATAGQPVELAVAGVREFDLSSERAAKKIRAILGQRRQIPFVGLAGLAATYSVLGGSLPYEKRDTAELEENLKNVKKDYEEDDAYDVFERAATKINIAISNDGDRYVEDASLVVTIPRCRGLIVVRRIREKPQYHNPLVGTIPDHGLFDRLGYPAVEELDDRFVIKSHIKAVKHQQPNLAFEQDLRIVIGEPVIGQTVTMHCSLFAKNLPRPVEQDLLIRVVEPGS